MSRLGKGIDNGPMKGFWGDSQTGKVLWEKIY